MIEYLGVRVTEYENHFTRQPVFPLNERFTDFYFSDALK